MVTVVDITVFLISLFVVFKILKRILKGSLNIYTILALLFWGFQFPSLVIDHVVDDCFSSFDFAKNMYPALTDPIVAVIYDGIILSVLLYLNKLGRIQQRTRLDDLIDFMKNLQFGFFINVILVLTMLLPIAGIILAPDPSIYAQWAYTYRFSISTTMELYHEIVIGNLILLSFFVWVVYTAQKRHSDFFSYLVILFLTWISFKRTMLVFGGLVLIFFDFFKGSFKLKPRTTIVKTICVIFVCIGYFIYYSQNTGKLSDAPFYYSYTLYYSRHYCLKTAIYDQLEGMSMLEYRGQSLLFDLLFFIPRNYWPDKPNVFTSSFTNYCVGNSYDYPTLTYYYANIWTEFVANFHLFGIIIALIFIKYAIKFSEKSGNIFAYMFGCLFVMFYFFWGIQPFTMIILVLWYFFLLTGFLRKLTR